MITRIKVQAHSGQVQFLSFWFFSGAGAPFVDITDLSLVESIEVGPTDTGGFMATGTSIISSKKALCSPAITTPTPDNSQSRMFRNAEVMEQCGISLPH